MRKSTNKNSLSGRKDLAPESPYERAFHPRGKHGKTTCSWIETETKRRGIHIHYQLWGHGGERLIDGHPMDGYHHKSKTVYQIHSCHFHGCPQCYRTEHVLLLGERAECNTRRCVSKNVTKKWSKCQSGIQLGCAVESWEAIPKALQASRQAEWDVSTRDWDTHSWFGFSGRAYSRISVPGGHVRQRAGAHFGKGPEGADKTVLGNADQARRNLEEEGATKLCAGRLETIVEKTADDSTGLVQSNTDSGLQLEQVWSEYYQKVFHNAH